MLWFLGKQSNRTAQATKFHYVHSDDVLFHYFTFLSKYRGNYDEYYFASISMYQFLLLKCPLKLQQQQISFTAHLSST